MLADSFAYALKSLRQRKLRSWLTVIGIFIGISAVVALISLGQGLQDAVALQLSGLGADRITVQPRSAGFGPPGLGSDINITDEDLEVVRRARYVKVAAARVLQPVTVGHNNEEQSAFLTSVPEDTEGRALIFETIQAKIAEGRQLRPNDRGKVVLGINIAEDWKESTPDIRAGQRILIEDESFEVVGVMQKGGLPATDEAIIINEQNAFDLLNISNQYQFIVAKATSPENVDLAKEAIAKDLRKSRDVDEREEDFTVETSNDILETVNTILGAVTAVLVGIAAISLIVGGIGIMNTMYTSVVERRKEIGIMKSIGATNGQVLTLFLIEAGMLGLVGGLIGVALGAGLSRLVEIVAAQQLGPSILQASTPLWLVLGALTFGFVVGVLSGILPARQAARMQPVEALSK